MKNKQTKNKILKAAAAAILCGGFFCMNWLFQRAGRLDDVIIPPTGMPETASPFITPFDMPTDVKTAEPASPTAPPTALPTTPPTVTAGVTVTTEKPPSNKPSPSAPASPTVQPDIDSMRSHYKNDDIVGYLKIEGTSIDYPVVQYNDNDFYLGHDIHKNKSSAGWIFMDYENDINNKDYNTVIYGHNMKTNTMFHSLRNYTSYDFYKDHRYITFNTAYNNYVWEVFSFYKTETNFPYTQVVYPSKELFYFLAGQMKERSLYDTGVEITADSRILTLSTCTGAEEDTRYVLHARLVEKTE